MASKTRRDSGVEGVSWISGRDCPASGSHTSKPSWGPLKQGYIVIFTSLKLRQLTRGTAAHDEPASGSLRTTVAEEKEAVSYLLCKSC